MLSWWHGPSIFYLQTIRHPIQILWLAACIAARNKVFCSWRPQERQLHVRRPASGPDADGKAAVKPFASLHHTLRLGKMIWKLLTLVWNYDQ